MGYKITLVFFGVGCLLLGYLIFRSSFLPRILGAQIAIAGVCYEISGFANFVSPALNAKLYPYILLPGAAGEYSLILWLLVIGVNARRWNERASL